MVTKNNNKEKLFFLSIIMLAIILPLLIKKPFFHHVLIMIVLYATLGLAWNLMGGYLGYVSFGHATFFGIGAYTSTILFRNFGITPWIGMIIGALLAVLVASIISFPVFGFTLRGHYFAIGTLALGEISKILAENFDYIGGARGILIPLKPSSFSVFQFDSKLPYFYIFFVFLLITIAIMRVITNSKTGYYLQAIQEDENVAESLGVDTTLYKHIAFYISAFIVAIVGSFYAQYQLYFDPIMVFGMMVSVQMALIAILGGCSILWGPVVGAIIYIPLSEYIRSLMGGEGRGIDLIILGIVVLLIILFQPQGVAKIFKTFINKEGADNEKCIIGSP